MFIFISYSSKDRRFVTQLYESLSVYNAPVFLDERSLSPGDNIPREITGALEKATHVIYVISRYSLKSRWVEEELSIAKVRSLSGQGCRILPLRIDGSTLPASVAHIRAANFRRWRDDDAYLAAFRQLRSALSLSAKATVDAERHVARSYLTELLAAKELADTVAQLLFQLERLWFAIFRDRCTALMDATYWFWESAQKRAPIANARIAREVLSRTIQSTDTGNMPSVEKLLEELKRLESNYVYFSDTPRDQHEAFYRRIWEAEDQARATSAMLRSFLTDALAPEHRRERDA